jgi:hypothetical protein
MTSRINLRDVRPSMISDVSKHSSYCDILAPTKPTKHVSSSQHTSEVAVTALTLSFAPQLSQPDHVVSLASRCSFAQSRHRGQQRTRWNRFCMWLACRACFTDASLLTGTYFSSLRLGNGVRLWELTTLGLTVGSAPMQWWHNGEEGAMMCRRLKALYDTV